MSTEEKKEEIRKGGYLPLIGMAVFLLLVQLIAISMAPPFEESGMQFVEDTESVLNPILYIGMILVFTVFLLIIIKLNLDWFIQLFILLVVASTMYIVFDALVINIPGLTLSSQIFQSEIDVFSLIVTALLTISIYKYPEWYVIDTVGIIIGAGVTALFGISFGIIPVLVLLSILAIYDAISVYKTKHMITLAEGVMDLKIPILFVIPRERGYSFIKDTKMGEGDAYFMGLGDAIIPSMLVISANFPSKESSFYSLIENLPSIGSINVVALGTIIGTFVGYFILMSFVGKGKPHAGLPFLNSGAILGFLIACGIYGISLQVLWSSFINSVMSILG